MCDFIALTRCCNLISFLHLIYFKGDVTTFATNFYRSRDLGHAPYGENYWRAR